MSFKFGLLGASCALAALAVTPAAAEGTPSTTTQEARPPQRDVTGLGLGLGLAVQLGQNAVEKAELDENNIVRVANEADARAGLVLEGHYLFDVTKRGFLDGSHIGVGPFVAVQTGSNDNIVDAVGMGLLFGFRRPAESSNGWGSRFNIGIGAMLDPNVQKLGDGLERNQPLPTGETQIRYRQEHTLRGVLIVTYTP